MPEVMQKIIALSQRFWRGVSRGLLKDFILYHLFQPYTILQETESSLLLKSRRARMLFLLPKDPPAGPGTGKQVGVGEKEGGRDTRLTDYIYSANPLTEYSIRPFFKMRGGIFVDVGAFIGKYTLEVALQSSQNRILAIEPNPLSFAILKKNLQLNQVEHQVILVNEAVSDSRHRTVEFSLAGSVSRIIEDPTRVKDQTVRVNSLPLFEIIDRQGIRISDISLIKIDVEGYEQVILKQICDRAKELSRARIICEILARDPQKEANLRCMAESGFRVRQIDANNYLFS